MHRYLPQLLIHIAAALLLLGVLSIPTCPKKNRRHTTATPQPTPPLQLLEEAETTIQQQEEPPQLESLIQPPPPMTLEAPLPPEAPPSAPEKSTFASAMPQEPTPAIPALTISTGALPALPLPLNASNASGEGDDDSDGNAVAAAAIGVHSPPYPKGIIHPRYPRQALARGIEGRVLLRFTVDTAGRPKQIQVVESTPQGLFDSAAITAIQQTPFQPGMDASGKAVEATLTLPVTFRIHQLSP